MRTRDTEIINKLKILLLIISCVGIIIITLTYVSHKSDERRYIVHELDVENWVEYVIIDTKKQIIHRYRHGYDSTEKEWYSYYREFEIEDVTP